MKLSIRLKFTFGMVFLLIIILLLLGFPAFYLNKLSDKTDAILKENYLSVVYAREMSEGLIKINQEITNSFLVKRNPNRISVLSEIGKVNHALQLEKANITETGEDKLAISIEAGMSNYLYDIQNLMNDPWSLDSVMALQKQYETLQNQLLDLSKMNGAAIESKTDDAKVSAKNGLTGMVVLGSICFLITLSFIFSFASYFNERFFQLYNGIKEIFASNYRQRLYFDGNDEIYEISLLINQMAEKLDQLQKQEEQFVKFESYPENNEAERSIEELKEILVRIKRIENEAEKVILNLQTNNN